jgi:membrane protein YqaA with SNARE-associated domain
MQFGPELFKFEVVSQKEHDEKNKKTTEKRTISFDTEDIIAFFAGIAAVVMTIAMAAGWVEINKLTVSIASLSGVGAAVAKIIGARRGKTTADDDAGQAPADKHSKKDKKKKKP